MGSCVGFILVGALLCCISLLLIELWKSSDMHRPSDTLSQHATPTGILKYTMANGDIVLGGRGCKLLMVARPGVEGITYLNGWGRVVSKEEWDAIPVDDQPPRT